MADVNANIGINLETSAALAQLKDLQRQLAIFNTSINKSTAQAINGQKKLAANLVNAINDTGQFVAQLRNVDTTVESFSKNLEKNKFSIKEYFRFAGASTKTFGASFKSEFDTINKVAEQRVKRLQTQYIKLGRDASGTMQAISVMPKALDMGNYSVQMQMAAQRQALFNQLVKQGSTNLINFGKNTQWAGRQLMVGFTIPLMILGSTASKTFMEMEQAAISFRKVYGDLFTPEPERQQALESIEELGRMFTKYGIAVKDTLGLAADAAAAGFQGLDLQRQTTEATRLSVLGQIDTQRALETTIALQNAFKISSEELAGSINFLNAVENQTVLSLDDVTQAIPRVGPIVEQLGGDIKDLAFFLTAMKEGGVSAAQGANALKSGLASLIAPSEKSAAALMNYGININKIVEDNQGNLRETVIDFAAALDTLDPLNRSRAIEQLFGKFQFARISALFNNITRDGTQASRVLDLSTASLEELAQIAESELSVVSESTSVKFKAAMEELRLSLLPIGEEFLKAATPIVEFLSGIIERFGNLSDGTKKAITIMIAAIGGLAPIVLMSFGLLNNLIGNAIKFALTLRQGYLKLTGQSNILSQQTNFLTDAQMDALAAAHSLNQSHAGLTQVFNVEREALIKLIRVYQQGTTAAFNFANANRNIMAPGFNPGILKKDTEFYNKGVVMVPGSGNKDTVPAMLTPGEAIIPKEMAKRYAPLIRGMIAGNIPGYNEGLEGDAEFISTISQRVDRRSIGPVTQELERSLSIFTNLIDRATDEMKPVYEEQKRVFKQSVLDMESITTKILQKIRPERFPGMAESQYSHLTPGKAISRDQLRDMLPIIAETIGPTAAATELRTMNAVLQNRPDITEFSLKDLFAADIGTNQKLNKTVFGSGITTTDFLGDFEPRGTEKWRTMTENLDLRFESVKQELAILDDLVVTQIKESGAQWVTDTESNITELIATAASQGEKLERSQFISLEAISDQIIMNAEMFGDKFSNIIQKATGVVSSVKTPAGVQVANREMAAQTFANLPQTSGPLQNRFFHGPFLPDQQLDEWGFPVVVDPKTNKTVRHPLHTSARESAINSFIKGRLPTGNEERFRTSRGLAPMPRSLEQISTSLGVQSAQNVGQGAGTQSPSKFTIQDGEDIARGLEIGMQSRMDDVARVANQLGQTAVTESGLIVPKSALPTPRPVITQDLTRRMQMAAGGGGASIGRGVPFDPNYKVVAISPREITQAVTAGVSGGGTGNNPPTTFDQGPSEEFNESVTNNTKAVRSGTDRLHSMNRMMMSGSFALTSLAGAGQFAGGRLGELSNSVFKVSGLLFGLQAVIQLLTDQMITQLVANRLAAAKQAAAFASYGAGLAGRGGLLGKIAQVVVGIARFIGPLGALTGAVGLAYLAFRKFRSDQEKQTEAIEGLGNAAKLTADQVKTLGDFFGVVPQKLPSELSSGLFVTSAQERTQLESLKESEDFKEQFKPTIKSLREATASQARLTLQTIGLELSARGFAEEQIDLIVKALQEKAGKTELDIEFKDLSIKNYLKDLDKLTQRFENQVEKQSQRFVEKTGRQMTPDGVIDVTYKEFEPLTDQYRKLANAFGTNFSNAFDAISGQVRNGVIDAEKYQQSIGQLTKRFDDLSDAAKQVALAKMIKNLDQESQDAINAVKNEKDQVLLLTAAYLGLNVAKEAAILSRVATDAKDLRVVYQTRSDLDKRMADQLQKFAKASEEALKGTGNAINDATGELSDFDKKIQEVLLRLKNVKDAGINAAGGIKELIKVLTKSGTGLDKFNGIAQQMLNMGKVGLNREFIDYVTSLDQESQKAFISINKGIVKLTKDGRLLNKAFKEISIGDLSRSFREQTKDIRSQIIAYNKLRASGFSVAEALEAVANAQFAAQLATSKNSTETKQLIADYLRLLRIQKEFEALDPEAVFNKAYDEASELLDLQEEAIRLDFEPRIEKQQQVIDKIQDEIDKIQDEIDGIQLEIEVDRRNLEINFDRPIEALQREANILSNELTLLGRSADQINEKYDKQVDALNKVFEINQDIIAQEKSRVSLADALTRGDISAAAQAMQDFRSTQATARQNSVMDALQKARENEINNLRSATGRTRSEIEERQFQINQETFRLEQAKLPILDSIREKEDAIYLIQSTRLRAQEIALKKEQEELKKLETQYENALKPIKEKRLELEKIRNRMELAKFEGVNFEDQMKKVKDAVTKIKEEWDAIKSKEVTLTCKKEGCDCGGGGGGGGSGGGGSTKPKTTQKPKSGTDDGSDSEDDGLGYSRESTTDNIVDAYKDAMQYLDDSFRGVGPSGYEDNRSPAEVGRDNAAKQDAAAAKRAQEAKAAADGAKARAKNAVQIANVAKQDAAAAARGATKPATTKTIADLYREAAQYRAFGGMVSKIKGYAMGGKVKKYALGGLARGTDTVPAMLTPGEFVVRKYAVKDFGLDRLKAINSGTYNDGSVYNYNLSVNVKSEANPDEIAQTVITQIKRIEGQRVRGNRF